MKQTVVSTTQQSEWASSSSLGLFAFGLTTILLQFHNIGLINATMPVVFGLVWGGLAQVIAGIIAGKRNDLFHLTAFVSYGVFWIGLAFSFIWSHNGLDLGGADYAWVMVVWAIFTFCMMIGTFKADFVSLFVFATLVILFIMLAFVFFGSIPAKAAGYEGLFCGAAATYGGAAVVINNKFGRVVLPLGTFK